MNRYRGPTMGGPSKATASTVCQKCLKKGHYSYECKAVAQERPYIPRPSRTQQLFNPKLVPKLTSDVSQDLLRKKGIADEELAKKELERGRERDWQDDAVGLDITTKRARSTSSHSSVSVATISTKSSPSPPLAEDRSNPRHSMHSHYSSMPNLERKRRRSSFSSEGSCVSDRDHSSSRQVDRTHDRNIRRKFSEASPSGRGRRRSRAASRGHGPSVSRDRDSSRPDRKSLRTRSKSRSPPPRRRRRTSSFADRKDADLGTTSRSPDRRPIGHQRHTRNRSGQHVRRSRDRSISSESLGRRRHSNVDERYGATSRNNVRYAQAGHQNRGQPSRAIPRERSLSPFSKRLALTQSMNMGI